MVNTKKTVAFGYGAERFGKLTGHPDLDPSGLYVNRPDGCDPCLYSPLLLNNMCHINKNRQIDKDPWRYKGELEEWAKNLGYRNQKVLEYRKYQASVLGPAWHYVNWPGEYRPACMNVGLGRTPRFQPTKNLVPGPGTYYKTTPFKAPYGPHSGRPTFESGEPCRFKDSTTKWSLAPNRYKILDKDAIDQKSKKVVSLRGPYDLFTGKRDGSTIKNHFNTSLKVHAASWPLALKGTLDKYEKSHFGRMNKTNRNLPYKGRSALTELSMCPRRPQDPAPTTYEVVRPRVFQNNKCAFNSSYDRGPGYRRVEVWPGVGRYSLPGRRCGVPGQGHRHVFLSKVGRTIGAVIPQPMNSF